MLVQFIKKEEEIPEKKLNSAHNKEMTKQQQNESDIFSHNFIEICIANATMISFVLFCSL